MHIAIVGNGIAGVSAALRLRELEPSCRITLISGESRYHYSRPALMYLYMGHMTYQDVKPYEDHVWEEQRIDLVRDWVVSIDTRQQQLVLHKGGALPFDRLLLATGSRSNKFGWPGQDLPGVQGLYDLMDLRQLYENSAHCREAVIVGGGLIGIELAEMLLSRGVRVTFLVREGSYWANVLPAEESAMINDLVRHHGIDLRLETELSRIEAGGDGRVARVVTSAGESLDCQFVGLTAGVSPNIALAEGTPLETKRGFVVDPQLRTNVADIYAAGDCAEIRQPGQERHLLQQVWYTGKAQGRHAAEVLCGSEEPYDPGIWFNSAKFFDLEYQTYGDVHRQLPGEANLYWQHATDALAVRIVHVDGVVVGFNFMGTRYRHEVCERWIAERATVGHVLDHLREAAFDPELYVRHEAAIAASLRAQFADAQAVSR